MIDEKPADTAAAAPSSSPIGVVGEAVGIDVRDVVRQHKMGDVLVPALRGVSLKVNPGEFVAIMGPSGCGKSTLLSLLGGLDRPSAGTVEVGGLSLGTLGDRALADYRLRVTGTVFQSFNLIQTHSALQNVAMPMALAGVPKAERNRRAAELLRMVGLGDRLDHRPSRLSGGEQQRVAVARALANGPGLILADEPTGNLDDEAGAAILSLLRQLNQAGATLVVVTHDPEVAAHADRVVRLRNGQVTEDPGAPAGSAAAGRPSPPPRRLGAWEALRLGVGGVRRRKLRTGLSASGVAIGIGAMAIILSFAVGVNNSLVSSLQAAGQLQQVTLTSPFSPADPKAHKPLNQANLKKVRNLPHVSDAWGTGSIGGTLKTPGGKLVTGFAYAMAPLRETPPITSKFLKSGRLWSADSAKQTILPIYSLRLLGLTQQNAIGRHLTFRGGFVPTASSPNVKLPSPAPNLKFQGPELDVTIVGLTSSLGGGNGNEAAVVPLGLPYDTWRDYWTAYAHDTNYQGDEFGGFTLVADSSGRVDQVRDEAQKQGYRATTIADFLKGFSQFLTYVATGLGGLAGLALLVACLGIANTMYTAVLERTREIGIMKAIGARRADVRNMFLAEAATIGFIGGAVGLIIALLVGAGGNVVLNRLLQGQGIGLDLQLFQLTWYLVLGALVLAMAFSAVSGLLPAIRATRLDPNTALRHD